MIQARVGPPGWLLVALLLAACALTASAAAQRRILDGPTPDGLLVLQDDFETLATSTPGCQAGRVVWLVAGGPDVATPYPPACDAQLLADGSRVLLTIPGPSVVLADRRTGLSEREWRGAGAGRASPDTRAVVYMTASGAASAAIVLAPIAGGAERVLVRGPGVLAPLWSPDGAQVYVLDAAAPRRILRFDADGASKGQVPGSPAFPVEYPVWVDLQTWLYEADDHLWELDLPSGRVARLLSTTRRPHEPRLRGSGAVQREVIWPSTRGLELVSVATLRGTR